MEKAGSLILLLCIVSVIKLNAQIDTNKNNATNELFIYDLEALANMEIQITNPLKKNKIQKAPAIISVIDREEIKNSGARDLIDILRLIPGFDFATDVHSQIGLVSRGLWAFEGKVLIMIDGQTINELMYGTVPLEYHIPVENIKKIEIIRGASSVLYGGFAELAVINIITMDGKDINGLQSGTSIGTTDKTFPYETFAYINAGKKYGKTDFSFFAKYGKTFRSDQTYTDFAGNSFDMRQNTISPLHINSKLGTGNFKIKFIFDKYHTRTRDYFGTNLNNAYSKDFTSLHANAIYRFTWKNWQLKPEIYFKYDLPWISTEPAIDSYDSLIYHTLLQSVMRITPRLTANMDIRGNLNLLAGIEGNFDKARNLTGSAAPDFWNNSPTVHVNTFACFSELSYFTKNLSAILGARAEYNTFYGFDFVPRAGITYDLFNRVYLKFLYNQSFRSPTVANIDLNYPLFVQGLYPKISPEKTNFVNIEIQTKLSQYAMTSAGFFHNSTNNAISYFVDENGNEGYANISTLGTNGAEFTFKFKNHRIYSFVSYSYYITNTQDTTNIFNIPGIDNVYLGAPQHKISGIIHLKLYDRININPSFTYTSSKYAYTRAQASIAVYEKLPEELILNTAIYTKNFPFKNLEINFAVFNILNTKIKYAQPYNGWHAPVPGRSREYRISLSYKF